LWRNASDLYMSGWKYEGVCDDDDRRAENAVLRTKSCDQSIDTDVHPLALVVGRGAEVHSTAEGIQALAYGTRVSRCRTSTTRHDRTRTEMSLSGRRQPPGGGVAGSDPSSPPNTSGRRRVEHRLGGSRVRCSAWGRRRTRTSRPPPTTGLARRVASLRQTGTVAGGERSHGTAQDPHAAAREIERWALLRSWAEVL